MAILMRGARRARKKAGAKREETNWESGSPSVREVCLLGISTPLTEGDRLARAGRDYRVRVVQGAYAHLESLAIAEC